MRRLTHRLIGMLIAGMIPAIGPAEAAPRPGQGGPKACETTLSACTANLEACTGNLESCEALPVCGDGVVENGEKCDVGTLGSTCEGEGFAGGTLACGTGCTLDTSKCFATRFVDNGDGTITDHQTRLMWEKKSDEGDIHDKDHVYSWNKELAISPNGTAFTEFLGTLNDCGIGDGSTVSGGFAGYCDWRLPTRGELQTILDLFAEGCGLTLGGSPCIAPIFGPTSILHYWSSTALAGFPINAWTVYFGNGELENYGKNASFRVRAVRSIP